MGKDQCETCKYVGYCTSSSDRVITECSKYEHLDSAPAYNWDLSEFMKLWQESVQCSETEQE